MAIRVRTLLAASLVAVPCLVYTCPAFGHNGRDGAPPPLKTWLAQKDSGYGIQGRGPAAAPGGRFIDIYEGIVVRVDPKTGVRSYVQVGDVPANPARARSVVPATFGPGPDYWVNKEFEGNHYSAPAETSFAYEEPAQVSSYDEGDYGGYYLPAYGYGYGGGDFGRPGHGGGRPGGGDHDRPPPRTNGGIIGDPRRWSPPPGPYGGGVGSPPPYDDRGVGAPPPALRHGGFRTRG